MLPFQPPSETNVVQRLRSLAPLGHCPTGPPAIEPAYPPPFVPLAATRSLLRVGRRRFQPLLAQLPCILHRKSIEVPAQHVLVSTRLH